MFCNNDIFPPNILVRNDILDKINNLKDQKDNNQLIEKLIDELVVIIDFNFVHITLEEVKLEIS